MFTSTAQWTMGIYVMYVHTPNILFDYYHFSSITYGNISKIILDFFGLSIEIIRAFKSIDYNLWIMNR